jgi:hypothetical protein
VSAKRFDPVRDFKGDLALVPECPSLGAGTLLYEPQCASVEFKSIVIGLVRAIDDLAVVGMGFLTG